MHHGYYPKGGPAKSNQEAQVDMIEEALAWAGATSAKQACSALPAAPSSLSPCGRAQLTGAGPPRRCWTWGAA